MSVTFLKVCMKIIACILILLTVGSVSAQEIQSTYQASEEFDKKIVQELLFNCHEKKKLDDCASLKYREKDFDGAIKLYDEILAADPYQLQAHVSKAAVFLKQNELGKANDSWESYIQLLKTSDMKSPVIESRAREFFIPYLYDSLSKEQQRSTRADYLKSELTNAYDFWAEQLYEYADYEGALIQYKKLQFLFYQGYT